MTPTPASIRSRLGGELEMFGIVVAARVLMDPPLRRPEDILSREERDLLEPGALPRSAELMWAMPTDPVDPGAGWLFEPLFKGTRCLAVYDGESVHVLENGSQPISGIDPAICSSLREAGPRRFALDGLVVDVGSGRESFRIEGEDQPLPVTEEAGKSEERAGSGDELRVRLIAFDLLHVEELNLRPAPLLLRRKLLRGLIRFSPALLYCRESTAPGDTVFDRAARQGWRGVVAKRTASAYVAGPSPDWRAWQRESASDPDRRVSRPPRPDP